MEDNLKTKIAVPLFIDIQTLGLKLFDEAEIFEMPLALWGNTRYNIPLIFPSKERMLSTRGRRVKIEGLTEHIQGAIDAKFSYLATSHSDQRFSEINRRDRETKLVADYTPRAITGNVLSQVYDSEINSAFGADILRVFVNPKSEHERDVVEEFMRKNKNAGNLVVVGAGGHGRALNFMNTQIGAPFVCASPDGYSGNHFSGKLEYVYGLPTPKEYRDASK